MTAGQVSGFMFNRSPQLYKSGRRISEEGAFFRAHSHTQQIEMKRKNEEQLKTSERMDKTIQLVKTRGKVSIKQNNNKKTHLF